MTPTAAAPESRDFLDARAERFDAFGFNERRYDRWIRLASFYADRMLRTQVEGIERIPAEGAALLVGNHSGTVGHDFLCLQSVVRRRHPARRFVRGLHHVGANASPLYGYIVTQWAGCVLGHPRNAAYLIEKGELVVTYPEGGHSSARSGRSADELCPPEHWGDGFARLALDGGIPVVPIAGYGFERALPILFHSRRLGRLYGMDDGLYPVSPQTIFTLGLLPFLEGFFPKPCHTYLSVGEPVDLRELGPARLEGDDDVHKVSLRFRELLQEQVRELARRVDPARARP